MLRAPAGASADLCCKLPQDLARQDGGTARTDERTSRASCPEQRKARTFGATGADVFVRGGQAWYRRAMALTGRCTIALLLVLWAGRVPIAQEQGRADSDWRGMRILLDTLADRFGPTERERGFEMVRSRLARGALVPSPLFDDVSVWMTRGDTWRALELTG